MYVVEVKSGRKYIQRLKYTDLAKATETLAKLEKQYGSTYTVELKECVD